MDMLDVELSKILGRNATDEEVNAHAEAELIVYKCKDCQQPYCAGRVDCIQALDEEVATDRHRCQACLWSESLLGARHHCEQHGPRFAIFKCDQCCDVAVWTCGTMHYCERCHNQIGTTHNCLGFATCPLGVQHPPNGITAAHFVVGCTACLGCIDSNDITSEYGGSDYGFDYDDDYDCLDVWLDSFPEWLRKDRCDAARAKSSFHAAQRKANAATKRARAKNGKSGQRLQRFRGGRHKVSSLLWLDSCLARQNTDRQANLYREYLQPVVDKCIEPKA